MPIQDPAIRILTYNVQMLPGLLSGSGDLERAKAIVDEIVAADPRYDVVCLQEVFDEDSREVFKRGLMDAFPHQVPKCEDGFFKQDSGLFFATKFPLTPTHRRGWRFQEFDDTAPFWIGDFFAAKGIFLATLDVSEKWPGMVLLLGNTHLQSDASNRGSFEKVRRGQYRQLRRFMVKTLLSAKDPAKIGTVLVGDMNVIAEKPEKMPLIPRKEYLRMLEDFQYARDLYRELNDDPGYTWDSRINPMTVRRSVGRRLRLDYAFAFDAIPVHRAPEPRSLARLACDRAKVVQFKNQERDLSDHFAVDVTVQFRGPNA